MKQTTNHPLFLREEFFGSILYNTLDKNYYFFDQETTTAIKQILSGSYDQEDEDLLEFHNDLLEQGLLSSNVIILKRSREQQLSAPLRVFLDITYLCNLRCKHCFIDSSLQKEKELTTKEIFRLIDQMQEAGSFLLSIAGGEPLLRKDLYEVIAYAHSKHIAISFTTNGLLITEEIAKKLDQARLKTITVSIDGIEKHHDFIRGKGKFRCAITNLKRLRQHCSSATIAIKNTVNSLNINDYRELISLAEKLGLDAIKFNPIRLFGRTEEHRELLISQDQYIRFLTDVQQVETSLAVSLPKTPLDTQEYEFIPLGFGCTGGKETCNITPTGEFSACAFLGKEYVIGNIKQEPLLDLWKKTNATVNYCGNETCNRCSGYKNCRGGCRSRALFECQNIDAVDPLCPLRKN